MASFLRNLDSASRDLVDMFKALTLVSAVGLVVICVVSYFLFF